MIECDGYWLIIAFFRYITRKGGTRTKTVGAGLKPAR